MTSEPPPSPSPLDALRACQWVDVVEISEPESNSLRIERRWGQDPGSQGRGIAAILALTAKHSAAPKIASRSTLEAV